MTTLSSREFNQDVGKAKRAAQGGPVFVTDRGRPTHVLLSFDAFRQMSGQGETIVDLLALPDDVDGTADSPPSAAWDRRESL